ncbi:hypothetical protein [Halostagnicola sp. A56]|uniref:hypothetical protein n=1 Tax=Halostagnicola sp. A56 TaxID=1495067 RepID=UPI0012E255F9|nr:hypothetical protein [Halostagnicola sp. A56]
MIETTKQQIQMDALVMYTTESEDKTPKPPKWVYEVSKKVANEHNKKVTKGVVISQVLMLHENYSHKLNSTEELLDSQLDELVRDGFAYELNNIQVRQRSEEQLKRIASESIAEEANAAVPAAAVDRGTNLDVPVHNVRDSLPVKQLLVTAEFLRVNLLCGPFG